ncbi:MAG: radical SAM protein [Candidatus Lernaella stagnicola]|nr:radical SAM protein [Candidatus Lernaella stagnicola]
MDERLRSRARELLRRNKHDSRRSSSVGIQITTRCNVKCRHCIGPFFSSDLPPLTPRRLRDWLERIRAESSANQVCFTGGEPFLVPDALAAAAGHATKLGFYTVVVSNGSWARSPRIAMDRLSPLAAAGLKHVSLSFDSYHREYVPTAFIRHAFDACSRLGIETGFNLLQDDFADDSQVEDFLLETFGQRVADIATVSIASVIRHGRAVNLPPLAGDQDIKEHGTCGAMGILVQQSGHVSACCGPPQSPQSALTVGHMDTDAFGDIYGRALTAPFPLLIQSEGIRFVQRLAGLPSTEPLYAAQRCMACMRLANDERVQEAVNEGFTSLDRRINLAAQILLGTGDELPLTLLLDEKNRLQEEMAG